MYGCCAITLANKQPSTVNGSPESIVDRAVKRAARITGSWAEEIAEAVEGLDTEERIRAVLRRIERELDVDELEGAIAEADLHASMLGALDAHYEAETENRIAIPKFKESAFVWLLEEKAPGFAGGNFASRGIDQAVGVFNRLEVLQVESLADAYEQLDERAIRHGFWVSGEARKSMLKLVRRELARQIQKGADLRSFRKWVKARLESAGWTPKNRSHVETIFRSNVMRAYNAGRAVQMQHPTVLRERPYWRISGIKDNRTRATHRAVQGMILHATDPAFQLAYPPFGWNCRERCTSQRTASSVTDGSVLLKYVPDPGFRSGLKGLISTPGPKPPKNHPKPTPEAKRPKRLPPPKPPGLEATLRSAEGAGYVPMETSPVRDLVGGQRLTNASARVFEREPNVFSVAVKANELDGRMVRTYDLNTKTVTHDILVVKKEFQGQGNVGLKLLKDQAEAYQRMGIKEIKLDAAWVGRYVWPSLGFRPPAAVESRIVKAFREWGAAQGVEIPASIDSAPKVATFKVGARKLGKEYLLNHSEDGLVPDYSATPQTVLEHLKRRGL